MSTDIVSTREKETDASQEVSAHGVIANVARHGLVYGVAGAAAKLVGFVMIPVYTRFLTPSDYGILELFQLTANLIGIILALGFTSSVLRFYFQYNSKRDRDQVISTGLIATITVALGVTMLLLPQSRRLSELLAGSGAHQQLMVIVMFTSFFSVSLIVPMAYMRALEKSAMYGATSLARLAAGLGLNILFVVVLRMGVLGVLLSGLIVGGLTSAGLIGWTARRVPFGVSAAKLNEMVRYGSPLVVATLGMFVLHFSDRFLLRRLATLEDVGLYALGYKFAMMLPALVMEPFGLIWGAAVFSIFRRDDAPKIYAKVFTYLMLVAVFFTLGVSLLIKDVVKVVATPRFLPAHAVVPVVMLGLLCLASAQFFETGVHLMKRTVYRAIALVSAAACNILLNLVLIPRYGMMGAAFATLLSFAFLAALAYLFGQRLYRIPYEFGRVARIGVTAIAVYWVSTLLSLESVAMSVGVRIVLLAVFPMLLWVTGFFHQDELEQAREAKRTLRDIIRSRLARGRGVA